MKIAVPKNTSEEKEKPPLPLIPETESELSGEKDYTKCSSFKLLTNPANADSPKYHFAVAYVDGTQTIRAHIKWIQDVYRVHRGLNLMTGNAKHQITLQLCHGTVNTAYSEGVQAQ